MSHYDDDIKSKKWKALKAAVGMSVSQGGFRDRRMSIDEVLLNINNVSFDALVRQTDIQTEEDKKYYSEKGYNFVLTESEFKEKFSVDPSCIWYSPSFYQSSLYFNEETFAAAPFHMEYFLNGLFSEMDNFYRIIDETEKQASDLDFMHSLISLPDGMRIEYFNQLIESKGTEIPGLYNLFFSLYSESDYGFGNMDPDTVKAILSTKSAEDIAKTKEAIQDLPETVKIYRGGNSSSTPCDKAYSWTLDINTANFFACRRGTGEGYIAEAEVARKDIIEYLEGRGEEEVFVNPENVRILSQIKVKGLDFVAETLPQIAPVYQEYISQMAELSFAQNSSVHGCEHEARVLLNSLTLSKLLDLPLRDRKVLATAAIYHDTQRTNDDVDPTHGSASRDYYCTVAESPDPLVAFLCEYHCLPDEAAYKEIMSNRKLSKNRTRAKLLFDVFKDADALDRVRFGLRDLDLKQLRIPASKELSLVARLYWENVDVPIKPKIRKPALSDRISSAASRAAGSKESFDRKAKNTTFEH